MMYRASLLLIFLFCINNLLAQTGYWTGALYQDGKRHSMSLYLQKEGKLLTGKSNIIINDILYEVALYGLIHSDRSINLWDTLLDESTLPEEVQGFLRRYQLIYRRSIAGDTLEGYWQEVHDHPHKVYKKGFIDLKRSKAKA